MINDIGFAAFALCVLVLIIFAGVMIITSHLEDLDEDEE